MNRYVAFSEDGSPVHLRSAPGGQRARQVIWGDYLHTDGVVNAGWLEVTWAPNSDNPEVLYIEEGKTTLERPLEIVFVDVGQGDGAVLITPEAGQHERVMVIDAGEGHEMAQFLADRFGSYDTGRDFHAAVITHADKDHYHGFRPIFDARRSEEPHSDVPAADADDHLIGFDFVYHPGLLEGPDGSGYARIGGFQPHNGRNYITDGIIRTDAQVAERFPAAPHSGKPFTRLIQAALENPKINSFRMLSTEDGELHNGARYVPGFAPTDGRNYHMRVLGPVVEDVDGVDGLRTLGGYDKTKNGHSVTLKLTVGAFTVLLGGDLNEQAEKFVLPHAAGLTEWPKPDFADPNPDADELTERARYELMIASGRALYSADVMKVCHHGSEKVTDEFIMAVHPAVFVISSGDEEGHVHPRPDLLGRLGKQGRGSAPVLLSTELQRGTRAEEDPDFVAGIARRIGELVAHHPDPIPQDTLADLQEDVAELGRANVSVYGSIYLKTDGTKLIAAFKKETDSKTDRWFYFHYELDDQNELVLVDTV